MADPVLPESLLANFRVLDANTEGTVSGNLRTLIVGRDLAYRPYVLGGQGLIDAYDAALGATAPWPGLVSGEVVDFSTVTVSIVQALVKYFEDVAAPPTIAQGQRSGTSTARIVHNNGATIFSGGSSTLTVPAQVGDYIKLSDGVDVLETRIVAFESAFSVIVLEDSIPSAIGAFFNITLAEIVPVASVPSSDYTATSTTITVDAGFTYATDRTGTAYPVVAGQNFAGDDYSVAYTSFGAFRTANTTQFLTITSPAQLDTYFIGWQYPESGLGFAIARALAPLVAPEVAVPAVLALAIPTDNAAGWTLSFSRAARRYDWYSVAPLTVDPVIITLCKQMVDARIAADYPSRMFIGLTITLEVVLYTGSLSATVDASQTPLENRTVSVTVDQPFAGAQSGDLVTLAGSEYVIDTVISNQLVTITTVPPAAPGVLALSEVVHPKTAVEQATEYGLNAAAYDSRAVSVVFPPDPLWNSTAISVMFLAAATAGLRGYTVPQQALRGVILESGWEVPSCSFEFLGELENVAYAGCFVYEASLPEPHRAVVAFTNTTDQGGAVVDTYEGMCANTDAVERFFKDLVVAFEGRTKVTSPNLVELSTQASTGLENRLRTDSVINPFGAVVVQGSVQPAFQDPANASTAVLPYTYSVAATLQIVRISSEVTIELVA